MSVQLDLEAALRNIARFSIPGWNELTCDDVQVSILGTSYINLTTLIERKSSSGSGAKKLVYKKYQASACYTEADGMFSVRPAYVQSLVAYEYARRGWGPKTFGILENARVEEYVESHTLDPAEAFTSEISQDLGKAYANFHTMDVPLVKDQGDILGVVSGFTDEMVERVVEWIASGEVSQQTIEQYKFDEFVTFPYKEEIQWIKSIESKIKQRVVLGCMDPQYLNRLVKNDKPQGQNETRSVLIDYDLVAYCVRGIDLSGHFLSRMISWEVKNGSFYSGFPYPSESEREEFLTSYLSQCKSVLSDFDETSLDSLENLKLETDLHSLSYVIIILSFTKAMFPYYKAVPTSCGHIAALLSLYKQLKDDFCKRYPLLFIYK